MCVSPIWIFFYHNFVSCRFFLTCLLGTGHVSPGLYYRNSIHCLQDLLRKHGLRSCYRGFTVQTLRDVPASTIYFTFYEKASATLIQLGFTDTRRIVPSLLAGGMAGVVSWIAIMPFDVVKSIYQSDQNCYKGLVDCTRTLWKQQGLRGFFAGTLAVSVRAFPVNAVTFAVYNESLKLLN